MLDFPVRNDGEFSAFIQIMENIKSGIYGIKNKLDHKIYVGKSKNIKRRWSGHRSNLKRKVKRKDTNRYLWNAVQKYGLENFEFIILEELPIDEDIFKIRELHWMDYYNSYNTDFGYNLRRDSKTSMIVHDDTKALISQAVKGENNPNYGNKWTDEQKKYMSELKKEGYKNGTLTTDKEALKRGTETRNKRWEENPQLKADMQKKVSENHNLYEYLKLSMDGEILEVYQNRLEVREAYPDAGKTVILSVCNGYKKSYKGFLWRYRDRASGEIIQPTPKWNKGLRDSLKTLT